MGMAERISTAQLSSDLSDRPDRIADVDVIRATGMAAASHGLGVQLWRAKYSADARGLTAALFALRDRVARRFGLDQPAAETVAAGVVHHWLDDACDACGGTGYEPVPGTPMLSDRPCAVCGGTGRQRLAIEGPAAAWLLAEIASLERQAAGEIMRRLSDELDG